MSRGSVISSVGVAVLVVGGWAWAFQEQESASDESPELKHPKTVTEPLGEITQDQPIQFHHSTSDWVVTGELPENAEALASPPLPVDPQWIVSGGSDATVLLEAKSGRTWVLHRSQKGTPMWLPAMRIDKADQAAAYLRYDKELAAESEG